MVKSTAGTFRLAEDCQLKKPLKYSRKISNFLVINSRTHVFFPSCILRRKIIKNLKRKKNDTGACAEHFSKGFITASESNALRSANAAVSEKELHLSTHLGGTDFQTQKIYQGGNMVF